MNKLNFMCEKSALKDTVKGAETVIVANVDRWLHPTRPRPFRDHQVLLVHDQLVPLIKFIYFLIYIYLNKKN